MAVPLRDTTLILLDLAPLIHFSLISFEANTRHNPFDGRFKPHWESRNSLASLSRSLKISKGFPKMSLVSKSRQARIETSEQIDIECKFYWKPFKKSECGIFTTLYRFFDVRFMRNTLLTAHLRFFSKNFLIFPNTSSHAPSWFISDCVSCTSSFDGENS